MDPIRIVGPTGRVTWVDTRPGAIIPYWIETYTDSRGTLLYVDTGEEGGTQPLPEVVVEGTRSVPWWLVLAGVVVLWWVVDAST